MISTYAVLSDYSDQSASPNSLAGRPVVTAEEIVGRNTKLVYEIARKLGLPPVTISTRFTGDSLSVDCSISHNPDGSYNDTVNALSASLSIFLISRIQAELMIELGQLLCGGMSVGKNPGKIKGLSEEEKSDVMPCNHARHIADRNILPVIAVDAHTSDCFTSFFFETGLVENEAGLDSIFFDLSKIDKIRGLDYMAAQNVLGGILRDRIGPDYQFPALLGYEEHREAFIRSIRHMRSHSSDPIRDSNLKWARDFLHNRSAGRYLPADKARLCWIGPGDV